jgi:hypothetical protein
MDLAPVQVQEITEDLQVILQLPAVLRIRNWSRIRKDPKLLTGSGSEINISDPDSNPDSNPDPKPDPKQSSKKESYFQAKKS